MPRVMLRPYQPTTVPYAYPNRFAGYGAINESGINLAALLGASKAKTDADTRNMVIAGVGVAVGLGVLAYLIL